MINSSQLGWGDKCIDCLDPLTLSRLKGLDRLLVSGWTSGVWINEGWITRCTKNLQQNFTVRYTLWSTLDDDVWAAGGCADRRCCVLEQRRTTGSRAWHHWRQSERCFMLPSPARHQWTHQWGEAKSHLHTVSRFLLSTATFLLAARLRMRCIPKPSDAISAPGSETGLRPVVVRDAWGADGQGTVGSCSCSPSTRWATRMAKERADKLGVMVVRAGASFKIKATVMGHLPWRSIWLLRFATGQPQIGWIRIYNCSSCILHIGGNWQVLIWDIILKRVHQGGKHCWLRNKIKSSDFIVLFFSDYIPMILIIISRCTYLFNFGTFSHPYCNTGPLIEKKNR